MDEYYLKGGESLATGILSGFGRPIGGAPTLDTPDIDGSLKPVDSSVLPLLITGAVAPTPPTLFLA
jgi:hypothetical protein